MPDNLRLVLKEMDDWMIARGTDDLRVLTEAEVIKWRGALAAALDRLDRVERASLSAVQAYLLRPPTEATPSSPSARPTASARQKHIARLASAMATLEHELAVGRSPEALSHEIHPPADSGD